MCCRCIWCSSADSSRHNAITSIGSIFSCLLCSVKLCLASYLSNICLHCPLTFCVEQCFWSVLSHYVSVYTNRPVLSSGTPYADGIHPAPLDVILQLVLSCPQLWTLLINSTKSGDLILVISKITGFLDNISTKTTVVGAKMCLLVFQSRKVFYLCGYSTIYQPLLF